MFPPRPDAGDCHRPIVGVDNKIVIVYHAIGIAVGVQQQKVLAGVKQHSVRGDRCDAGLEHGVARIPIVAKAPETMGRAVVACAA